MGPAGGLVETCLSVSSSELLCLLSVLTAYLHLSNLSNLAVVVVQFINSSFL